MDSCLLAIDQGTTGTTALVFGADGRALGRATCQLPQHFPQAAWVEHEPEEILSGVRKAVAEALRSASLAGDAIAAVGLTNQRETTLLWDRSTGRPVHRAIVWQDRRTSGVCARLREQGHEGLVRERAGLVLDPYFSATKLCWLLDHVAGARERAGRGELAFGTVDSFLVSELGGGPSQGAPHVIEISNASRTALMNLRTGQWDMELCRLFGVPQAVLPRIVDSTGPFTRTRGFGPLPDGVPVSGVLGDQQAALLGQGCVEPGDIKCTYGTGAFVVANTGAAPALSRNGLLSSVAWRIGGQTVYALEGSCFVAGAAVQWLRDGLGLIQNASQIEPLAASVPDSDGVVFVPALSGLGAPFWDADARGLICGLTRRSTAAHIARATLEAIAFQVAELVLAMADDLGASEPWGTPAAAGGKAESQAAGPALGELRLGRVRVDGGAATNNLLLQLQADVSQLCIERPEELETTARGAALVAALGAGLVPDLSRSSSMTQAIQQFCPQISQEQQRVRMAGWRAAVTRTLSPDGSAPRSVV